MGQDQRGGIHFPTTLITLTPQHPILNTILAILAQQLLRMMTPLLLYCANIIFYYRPYHRDFERQINKDIVPMHRPPYSRSWSQREST